MWQNLSSAAVVIGALRVNFFREGTPIPCKTYWNHRKYHYDQIMDELCQQRSAYKRQHLMMSQKIYLSQFMRLWWGKTKQVEFPITCKELRHNGRKYSARNMRLRVWRKRNNN